MTEAVLLRPHAKDLGGGFMVRRSLPSAQRQAVGPFLFFDHFGPIAAQPSDNHDVRPHPHIGLATVTYLFEGAMMHRDSTGVVQRIEPGAINWMTAGRGIVHSERTPEDLRDKPRRSHGLQLWCALPAEHEEDEPSFQHTPAQALPEVVLPDAAVRVLIGSAFGATSPIATLSPTLYLDIALASGGSIAIPDAAQERAVYSTDADIELGGQAVPACTMAVLPAHGQPVLHAKGGARVVVIGGAPLGHRFMVWNFVSSRKERIAQAQDDWEAQAFAKVPGETEFIPLPPRRPE
ncbi:MAG: pirin family protein [Piscinibacter sp.]|nr:pirin family protein [Piscinibacter sp.]